MATVTGLSALKQRFANPNEGSNPEVNEFNDKLQTYFKENRLFADISVFKLDRGVYDLSYSMSIVHKKVGNTVAYFILVYACTNKSHLTLIEYEELKDRGVRTPVLPSNALNKKAGMAIEDILNKEYGDNIKLEAIDGNVIPETANLEDDQTVVKYGTLAGNFINSRTAALENGWSESDFGQILSKAKVIKAYPTTVSAASRYEIDGVPQFVEFQMNITAIDGDNSEEVNKEGTSVGLGKLLGNVQFIAGVSRNARIRTKVDAKVSKAFRANGKVVAHPVMVMNALEDAFITSLGTTFMAIASAGVATAQGRWKEIAVENADVPGKNPGELELIVNSDGNEIPKRMNLADNSLSYEDKIELISILVEGSPLLALDIDKFKSQTSHFTVLLRASKEAFGRSASKENLKRLIKGANEFTNGHFPLEFPVSKIYGKQTIILPTGYFKDGKRGERSLDEIDTLMMLKRLGVKDAILKMRLDNGLVEKGTDTVDMYLKLMKKISPDIKITGFKERVYLNVVFVLELYKSIRKAGINLVVPEPENLNVGAEMPDVSLFDQIGFGDGTFSALDSGFGGTGFESYDFM